MLVRDEDLFLEWAIRNVIEFCDRLIVANHGSRDDTGTILFRLSRECRHLDVFDITCPTESHDLIAGYAGTPTWIFAVDGDEIYDPDGLARLRPRLINGEFDAWWQVFGNVLNCTEIDCNGAGAVGYLAPPCRSMTKLFNFNAIDAWTGDCPERLHGGEVRYRAGYLHAPRRNLHEEVDWDESDYRCLHACFMRRSSLDDINEPGRANIMEKIAAEQSGWWQAMRRRVGALNSGNAGYKREKYMRGALVEKDITAFQPARCRNA